MSRVWTRLVRSLLTAWCGLALTAAFASAADDAVRPNIVLIVADDLGWNDVGYHGSEIRTPNLDALAHSGVKLEAHYVFPTCSPTRAALLSGRNPSRFGILGPIDGRSRLALPPETVTLADVLKDRGYATAMVGKWHLGLHPEVGPRQYGFDSTYGYLHGQIDPYTHHYKTGDRTWHRDDGFVDEQGHATDLLAAAAVKWIETPRTSPFFLDLAFSVPHTPLHEEPRWLAPYADRIADPSRRLYAAAVAHMDAVIGQVVAALDRTGQRERTLILFTSDNGGQQDSPPSADYGSTFRPHPTLGNNRPLRGWKGELYEGGIRVPAFLNWRGRLDPKTISAPVSVLDWLPTLAAMTGYRADQTLRWEGVDLSGPLFGSAAPGQRRFYWKTPRESAVREGDWKLIVQNRGASKPQLFHLSEDANETTDLAHREPEKVGLLRGRLHAEQSLDPQTP